jgi:hypothetical protein
MDINLTAPAACANPVGRTVVTLIETLKEFIAHPIRLAETPADAVRTGDRRSGDIHKHHEESPPHSGPLSRPRQLLFTAL